MHIIDIQAVLHTRGEVSWGKAVFSNQSVLWMDKVSEFSVVDPGCRKEQRELE